MSVEAENKGKDMKGSSTNTGGSRTFVNMNTDNYQTVRVVKILGEDVLAVALVLK